MKSWDLHVCDRASTIVTVTGPSVDLFLISRRSTVYLPRLEVKKVSPTAQLLELASTITHVDRVKKSNP